MTIADLQTIVTFFQRTTLDEVSRTMLVKEALLMTLARATNADSNISPIEVETVLAVIRKVTGEELSAADVRLAAKSELFEQTTLDRALARLSGQLSDEDRALITRCLAEVIQADCRVTAREAAFFDRIAAALDVSPSRLIGLVPDS